MSYPRILFIVLLLVTATVCCVRAEEEISPLRKFYQAGSAYQDGDYEQAIKIYRSLLESGLESGAIYYNLGNSYFKNNQLGLVVLNYERAKRLIPRDTQLDFNARYAHSLVKDYTPQEESSIVSRKYEDYKNSFTVDELTWITFFLLFMAALIYTASLFLKWPKQKVILVICILSVLAIFHLSVCIVKLEEVGKKAVMIEETNAKYEPSEKATNYFKLPEGEVVWVLKKEYGWYKVKRSDNKTGWVKSQAIGTI